MCFQSSKDVLLLFQSVSSRRWTCILMNVVVAQPIGIFYRQRRPFSGLLSSATQKPVGSSALSLSTAKTPVRRPCSQRKPRRAVSKRSRAWMRSLDKVISQCSDMPTTDPDLCQSRSLLRSNPQAKLCPDDYLQEALSLKATSFTDKAPKVWLVPKPVLNRTLQRKMRRLSL